jgi:molybdopterin synthase catalytic subunit
MIELTEQPLDYYVWTEKVRRSDCGAVVTFLGTVRDLTGDQQTVALDYESHRPMAMKKLEQIEAEVRERWPVREIVLVHRLGKLEVSEISVIVSVSCPHRVDAFAACQYAIDRLKEIVPIWKREIDPQGQAHWIHPK